MCACAPFAGPLLLNAFLRYLRLAANRRESDDEDLRATYVGMSNSFLEASSWIPQADSLAFGCGCVALLGLAAALKVSTF